MAEITEKNEEKAEGTAQGYKLSPASASLRVISSQGYAESPQEGYRSRVLEYASRISNSQIKSYDVALRIIADNSKKSNIQFVDVLEIDEKFSAILEENYGARAAISLGIEMNENLMLLDQRRGFARSLITHLANVYSWNYQIISWADFYSASIPTEKENNKETEYINDLVLHATNMDNTAERRLVVIEDISRASSKFVQVFNKMILSRTIGGRPVPSNVCFVLIESGENELATDKYSAFLEQSFCFYIDAADMRKQDAFYYYMERRQALARKLEVAKASGNLAKVEKIKRLMVKDNPLKFECRITTDVNLKRQIDNLITDIQDANASRKQQILLDIIEPELSSRRMEIAEIMMAALVGPTASSQIMRDYFSNINESMHLSNQTLRGYFLDDSITAESLIEVCSENSDYFIYAVKEFMSIAEELQAIGKERSEVSDKIDSFIDFIFKRDKECFYAIHKTLPFLIDNH